VRHQVAGGIREARADAYPQFAVASGWGQSRSPAFLNSPDFEGILEQFPGGASNRRRRSSRPPSSS
jgi:hypothetical protein